MLYPFVSEDKINLSSINNNQLNKGSKGYIFDSIYYEMKPLRLDQQY